MGLWSQMAQGAGDVLRRMRDVPADVADGAFMGYNRMASPRDPAMRAGEFMGKNARNVKEDPYGAAAALGSGALAGAAINEAMGGTNPVEKVISWQQEEGRRFTPAEIVQRLVDDGMDPEEAKVVAMKVQRMRNQ